jgi:hypothetical protein
VGCPFLPWIMIKKKVVRKRLPAENIKFSSDRNGESFSCLYLPFFEEYKTLMHP